MPTSGKVIRHLGSRVARLQQHHYKGEQLDPNLTALEHMRRLPQVGMVVVQEEAVEEELDEC